jgi:cell wall-associated NlpC family hydrolase
MYNDLIGKAFKDRGRGPDSYDCLGLLIEMYKRHGITIPDYNISCFDVLGIHQQSGEAKQLWLKLSSPVYPCAVLVKNNSVYNNHVGFYLGNGKMIHAIPEANICIVDLTKINKRFKIEGFYKWGG